MKRIAIGHWQCGIYHCRRLTAGKWEITVEDGKGFPFDPLPIASLAAFRKWVGA